MSLIRRRCLDSNLLVGHRWKRFGVAPESHNGFLKGSCCLGSGVRVWDIVSELVCLCTIPSPSNPFALDVCYIKNLPLRDRYLVTGALLSFLETYVVYGNRDEMHYDKGRGSRRWVTVTHHHKRTSRWRCLADSHFSGLSDKSSHSSGGRGEASKAASHPVPAGAAAAPHVPVARGSRDYWQRTDFCSIAGQIKVFL